ncbi:unnamed protein product [Orchesella dallaii]|uniref:Spermatogenesis-associated protein 17 n=1 Tax=Orchesella dallaii TaxID=48710 RepID=A0ABP1QVP3_9HEXA
MAVVRYYAAVKIQAAWRGFLIRYNMKILHACAVKIQSWVRGFELRKKWKFVTSKAKNAKIKREMEEAATKIQAGWRGHMSRKNKFNFAQYKEVQAKNEALRRSIERINELEAALLKSLEPPRGAGDGAHSEDSLTRTPSSHHSSQHSIRSRPSLRKEPRTSSEQRIQDRKRRSTKGSAGRRIPGQDSTGEGAAGRGYDETGQGEPGRERGGEGRRGESRKLGSLSITSLSSGSFDESGNLIITPSLENFILTRFPDLVNDLSESRITELYAYLANMETEMKVEKELERLVRKLGGAHKLSPDQLYRLEESRRIQKERANLILTLAKLIMMGPLKQKLLEKDSVDRMFPPLPDVPDMVQPNSTKVQALKDAIRMIRQQARETEERELQKQHVLLRTKTCPGVYSDIYTTELTEIERKLKSVKFYKGSLIAESKRKRAELRKDRRLKRLLTHALRITSRPTSSVPGESGEEEEEGDDEEDDEMYNEEYCGEMGPEDDEDMDGSPHARRCYYLPPLSPAVPPPTPNYGVDEVPAASSDLEENDPV